MIDGVGFIRDNYERCNNSNDPVIYKELFHPDVLWCPPELEDKEGADLVAFSYALKGYNIKVNVKSLEGIRDKESSYVTGLVGVKTISKEGVQLEDFVLRGSWVVVEHKERLCIRYQVWNRK